MEAGKRELELYGTLKEIIQAESDEQLGDYGPDSRLDELGLSSLQRIRVMLRLEKTFHIEIDEDTALGMATIRDLLEYLNRTTPSAVPG